MPSSLMALNILEVPVEPTLGNLFVDTTPTKGNITINGISQGIAPITKNNITPGSYIIEFSNKLGYLTPLSETVTVKAGETTRIVREYIFIVTSFWELFIAWWNSLSITEKILVFTGISGVIATVAVSGRKRDE